MNDQQAVPGPAYDGHANLRRPNDATYQVRYLPKPNATINGWLDKRDWSLANVQKQFVFPWKKQVAAPRTEFRALCDDTHLYFTFHVDDTDLVVLDNLRDKQDVVFEDRVEMFFSVDPGMTDYFCVEVDPQGRAYDYRGAYYRKFDPTWSWPGLETTATLLAGGYVAQGRIPLASFEALGFPQLKPGAKILCGLYRAEFSHDRSGRPVVQQETVHNLGRKLDGAPPIEDWMSWIDPGTPEPDFHVPSSLGWLEIVE